MAFALWFFTIGVIVCVGWIAIQSGAGAAQSVLESGGARGCLLFIAAVIVLTMIALMLG